MQQVRSATHNSDHLSLPKNTKPTKRPQKLNQHAIPDKKNSQYKATLQTLKSLKFGHVHNQPYTHTVIEI